MDMGDPGQLDLSDPSPSGVDRNIVTEIHIRQTLRGNLRENQRGAPICQPNLC